MNKKILVTYATNAGSTADVAEFIGETIEKIGFQVSIRVVGDMDDIETFAGVFIGSPIINGKCMKEIRRFVRSHSHSLQQSAVAYFITCMRLSQVLGESQSGSELFIDPVFGDPKPKGQMTFPERSHPVTMYLKAIQRMDESINPIRISFFRGVLDYNRINFLMRLLFKFMARIDGLDQGDYRNWEAIRAWTEETCSSL